jgi:hypothetical protein
MATGDSADILARLKRVVPPKWWAFVAPLRDAVFGGVSDALASAYDFISYAALQTRLASATDFWLDLAALDFFGRLIRRRTGESDSAFSARIRAAILRERVTRAGMIKALSDLTGKTPSIFEPWNTGDTGGWGIACGYGVAGAWGSQLLADRAKAYVVARRSGGGGIPSVAGWGSPIGGWGVGSLVYEGVTQTGAVQDQDIVDMVNMTRAEGVKIVLSIID